jgi:predicted TIM-barrel fold metal-dependent hydrolase
LSPFWRAPKSSNDHPGVFGRFPKLQITVGHMDEDLPFFDKSIVEKTGEMTKVSRPPKLV